MMRGSGLTSSESLTPNSYNQSHRATPTLRQQMNGARNDLNNLDSQMGLIAKLKEIQEQIDSSSSGNENEEDASES